MTSTIAPPETKPERDPLRILSISANLLPVEITDARRAHKVRWVIAAGLVVVLAALAFWDVEARNQTSKARADLKTAEASVGLLQKQQASYKELNDTKASSALIEGELKKLMASDVEWYSVLPAVRGAAQASGVTVSNLVATMTATSNGSAATSSVAGAPVSVGSITITGIASDQTKAAAFLEQLAKIPGFTNPYLNSLSAQGGQYQFNGVVSFTSALYQGRYTSATADGGK